MPFVSVPVRLTLERQHSVRSPDGESVILEAGETLAGWAQAWRRKGPAGTPEAAAQQEMPDYFALEFHFLRGGRSCSYLGEVTQRLLRPTARDRFETPPSPVVDSPAFNLFDKFEALDPWPEQLPPRADIPSHITGFSYALELLDGRYRVDLAAAYRHLTYLRPLEELLFLPACRYRYAADGSFAARDDHAEPFVHVGPTPPALLGRVLLSNDAELIRAAFRTHPGQLNEALDGNPALRLILHPIQADRLDLLEVALELGADPSLRLDSPVGTPLHLAVQRDRPAMVSRLLAAGADPSLTDSKGQTPLHRAAKLGRQHLVEMLLAAGARDVPDPHTGLTASQMTALRGFHDAVRRGDLAAVEALLAAPAPPPLSLVDSPLDGTTALMLAAQLGNPRMLDALAAASRDLEQQGGPGDMRLTALRYAVGHRRLEAAEVLLRRGADPRARSGSASDPGGSQPLHAAAEANSRRIARLLLDHGAEVDARDGNGQTPLIIASWHRFGRKLVELLLERGADPNARDRDGKTPLQLAQERRHTRVAAVLEAAKRP